MKQHDSSLCSEQASLGQTILQKLSTIEDLLKKKDDKPLTFKDACAYLGYAPSYLYKLTYKNIVPHYKPTGKIIFFSKNEIDEWIFKGNVERRVQNVELKTEDTATSSSMGSELRLGTTDPNQVEMFEEQEKEKSNEGKKKRIKEEMKKKRNEEINETEILIEFPLKSRRRKEL